MTILKVSVNKVNANRNVKTNINKVDIKTNVSITNVEEMNFSTEDRKGLKIGFEFKCQYNPELGNIDVEGQIFYTDEVEKITGILNDWKNNKNLPMDIKKQVINAALHKGNIQAIKISEDVGLPSPLPLPKVREEE
jgi:hypothetical protein